MNGELRPIDEIIECLEGGPATQRAITAATGIPANRVKYLMAYLVKQQVVEKVGEEPGAIHPVAVYAIARVDTEAIVMAAMASRTPLEMAWAA